jgi:ketose-bisphosphate aldolase
MIEEFAKDIPVAIHLDHGQTFADCVDALRSGFTSIMCDASDRPIDENIAVTKKVVEIASAVGVSVEAEVGQLLTGESDPNSPLIVRLEDVRQFTAEVDVDMLAVAIGNSHGYYKGEPQINIQRLKEVRAITNVPLVLHGCTGMPEETVKECIATGMAKINFGTMLRNNFLTYFNEAYNNTDHQGHPWRCRQYAKDKLKEDVRWILSLAGSEGRA